MKRTIIIGSILVMALGLLTPQAMQAQGIVYLSNLGQTSTDSRSVGSDSWLAEPFLTGPNAGGYLLDSIQLALTNATGNPSGFTLLLYSAIRNGEYYPSSSLGTLDGSPNPATGGIYTYTPDSSLLLAPGTAYFIVLTSGTLVANGAVNWSLAKTLSYNPSGGWFAPAGFAGADNYQSVNGSTWNPASGIYGKYAINATAIPEPGILSLSALGGLALLWQRRKF